MAETDQQFSPVDGLEGLNATTNSTTNDTVTSSILANLQDVNFILLEAKIIFGAMGIIYLGAHAALRRPPSAAPPKSKKTGKTRRDEDRFSQGLERSDAIMFPLMAAGILVGLYYLIQWLKDPAIINKILQYYMSFMSIASLLTLYAHGIEFFTGLVFPRFWKRKDGGILRVNQKRRLAVRCDEGGNEIATPTSASDASPLPGVLGLLAPSARLRNLVWDIRDLLTKRWTFRFFAHGIADEKAKFKFAHVLALSLALASAGIYFSTTSPLLSNLLGYGMCYGSMLLLSPTDFVTGALVLVGLFVYDIVMVFYTPYMVTVATTLDVPIKLTFKAAAHKSILGLGDIVLPGMLMGWTLRFDLWLHYLRKIKYESTDLKIVAKDEASGQVITKSDTKHKEVKMPYVDVTGRWGEWLWSGGLTSFGQRLPLELAATQFSKTYFYASLVGYLLGMLTTLAMLLVYKRGQPALLYLVPGVLGSILVTALARGEMPELWKYTEDGSLDTEDVVVDLDGQGKAVKSLGQVENGVLVTTKSKDEKDKEEKEKTEKEDKKKEDEKAVADKKRRHQVLMVSIEALEDSD